MQYIAYKKLPNKDSDQALFEDEINKICDKCNELIGEDPQNKSNVSPLTSIWWQNIKLNDSDPSGRTIVEIISMSQFYLIYFDEKYNLNCAIFIEEKIQLKLFVEFDKLQQKIQRTLSGEDQKQSLRALGVAFGHGLSQSGTKDVCCCFADIAEFIETKCREKLQKYYISSTFLCCLLFIFIMVLFSSIGTESDIWLTNLKSATFGAVGAMISVLQRFKKMQISTYASPSYIVFEGFSRIMLGTFFGVILMLAVKGEILFATYSNNYSALSLFAIIAGLSERLIPEFIETIENRNRRRTDKLPPENLHLGGSSLKESK